VSEKGEEPRIFLSSPIAGGEQKAGGHTLSAVASDGNQHINLKIKGGTNGQKPSEASDREEIKYQRHSHLGPENGRS